MSGHAPKSGLPYETQEPDFRIIISIIPISLVVVVIFTFVCYFGAETSLSHEMDLKQTHGAEMASQKLEAFEAQEDSSMHNYGWADKKKGMVRIPVHEAMEMMVQKSGASK